MPRQNPPSLLLASTSPRRKDLLGQVRLRIDVRPPTSEEIPQDGEPPRRLVARLAREKAESIARARPDSRALVIAADTIVVAPGGGRVLGKPRDGADAVRMLRLLSGKTHTVYTGYCVLGSGGRSVARVVSTRVKIRALDRATIRRYVATGEPMDKAGSYAAQGLGMALVERVSGSYTNVVGLPIAQLLQDLEEVFGISLFSWIVPRSRGRRHR